MDDRSRVMPMDVMQALRRLEQAGRPFDIIFMDPPYHLDLEERIVPYLLQSSLVKAGSLDHRRDSVRYGCRLYV